MESDCLDCRGGWCIDGEAYGPCSVDWCEDPCEYKGLCMCSCHVGVADGPAA